MHACTWILEQTILETHYLSLIFLWGDRVIFVWLISHDRKYCWLIYCKRKTLLNDSANKLKPTSGTTRFFLTTWRVLDEKVIQ
jgi:hypothetical protein